MFSGDEVWSSTAFQTVPKRTCDSRQGDVLSAGAPLFVFYYADASDGSQYSALSQINLSNVSKLWVAWSYLTGDGNKYGSIRSWSTEGCMFSPATMRSSAGCEIRCRTMDPSHRNEDDADHQSWELSFGLPLASGASARACRSKCFCNRERIHIHAARETPLSQQFRFHVLPQRAPCHCSTVDYAYRL